MLKHNEKNDRLVREYRDLMRKAKEAANIEDKKQFEKLALEKHKEMITCEFEDKNAGRFNQF